MADGTDAVIGLIPTVLALGIVSKVAENITAKKKLGTAHKLGLHAANNSIIARHKARTLVHI